MGEQSDGMGVSSERVIDPDAVEGTIEGTGTHGTAVGRSNGTMDTRAIEPDAEQDDEDQP